MQLPPDFSMDSLLCYPNPKFANCKKILNENWIVNLKRYIKPKNKWYKMSCRSKQINCIESDVDYIKKTIENYYILECKIERLEREIEILKFTSQPLKHALVYTCFANAQEQREEWIAKGYTLVGCAPSINAEVFVLKDKNNG